jgi:DNA-binding NarL/FixJ family response regulator
MNRILIIENNVAFRNTLKNFLQSRFPAMAFEEAQNGEEALQKATYFCPDIIFMDIKLPMEAAAINEKLKNIFPEVTIVLFTNYDPNEYRGATEESGADYILQKGTSTAEEIVGLVDSILNLTHSFPIKESCLRPPIKRRIIVESGRNVPSEK